MDEFPDTLPAIYARLMLLNAQAQAMKDKCPARWDVTEPIAIDIVHAQINGALDQ